MNWFLLLSWCVYSVMVLLLLLWFSVVVSWLFLFVENFGLCMLFEL